MTIVVTYRMHQIIPDARKAKQEEKVGASRNRKRRGRVERSRVTHRSKEAREGPLFAPLDQVELSDVRCNKAIRCTRGENTQESDLKKAEGQKERIKFRFRFYFLPQRAGP